MHLEANMAGPDPEAFESRFLSFFESLAADGIIDAGKRLDPGPDASPAELRLGAAFNRLFEQLHADLLDVARLSNEVSAEAASNSFLINRIASSAREQSDQTAQLAAAVEQTARGAESVSENTHRARELTADLRANSDRSLGAMENSLASLVKLESGARATSAAIAKVRDFSQAIGSLVDVIDDISAAANLLGINAAIEAAHAGDAGRGFGVVASEIKKLADSTRASTRKIAATIKEVQQTIDAAAQTAEASSTHAADVGRAAATTRDDLARMMEIIAASTDQIASIATTVEEQSQTLQSVAQTVRTLSDRARSGAADADRAKELRLADLNRDTFAVIGRYELGSVFDAMRAEAFRCAEEIETALERLLASGALTEAALFDCTYTEVRGAEMRRFATLFSVERAGRAGFDPPKFATAWDAATDRALMEIVDRREAVAGLDYVCIVDINGYLTMHARKYRSAITGDFARDLAGNRVKRIFEDDVGLRCGRVGLAKAAEVPKRARPAQFAAAGVNLRRPAGPRPFLLQTYARDTGFVLNDLSSAIYVRGRHWGGVRFAYDPKFN
jgi:methyl-accepting chemotaxis protein